MINLSIFTDIKSFFVDTFTSISWSNIFILFTGIIIGFIICGIIYVIILLQGIKKADKKHIEEINKQEDIIKTNEANKAIRGAKDKFKEESKEYSFTLKVDVLKQSCWELMNDIALIYYKDSKYPLYELSIDELIKLSYYITQRIEHVFDGKVMGLCKNIKISQLIRIIEYKKKVEDSKIIKASKKAQVGKIAKVTSAMLNMVNPVYWVKKFMISSAISLGTNKVSNIIIDIVGQETAKVYSKHLFKDFDDVEKEIELLEKELS